MAIQDTPVIVTAGSILTVPTANQSVSGTLDIGNLPTTQNVSGSVVAFQNATPWVITGSVQSTAVANQSVSGTVGASIIGLTPVSVSNFPTTQNVSGSVVSFQGSGWSGSVAATVVGTPNVNAAGSVVSFQGTSPWIITGSVQSTAAPNQSVSGTVNTLPLGTIVTSLVSTIPSSVIVGASIFGLPPVNVTNTNLNIGGSVVAWLTSTNASVITVGTAAANQSVSGTVNTAQSGTVITSLVSTIPSSVLVGASIIGLTPVSVTNFPTTQNVSGSVISWLTSTNASVITVGTAAPNQSVSGTVNTLPLGTIVTSLVSTIPSSVIVGASIFGLPPVNVTNTNLNIGGSVVSFMAGAWTTSVVGTVTVAQGGNAGFASRWPVILTNGTQTVNVTSTSMLSVTVDASPGSVVAFQGGTRVTSLVSTVPSSVLVGASIFGTVPVTQSGTWAHSVVGGYNEDVAHILNSQGIYTLGLRNDTLASITSADLDYSPQAMGPSGELIVANAPLTKWVFASSVFAGGASVALIAAPGASVFTYVTGVHAVNQTGSSSVLLTIFGGTDSVLGKRMVAAGGNADINVTNGWKGRQNAPIAASIGAAVTLAITVTGFTAKS